MIRLKMIKYGNGENNIEALLRIDLLKKLIYRFFEIQRIHYQYLILNRRESGRNSYRHILSENRKDKA